MAVDARPIAWLAGFLEGRFMADPAVAHSLAATVGRDEILFSDVVLWTRTGEADSQELRGLLETAGLPWTSSQ